MRLNKQIMIVLSLLIFASTPAIASTPSPTQVPVTVTRSAEITGPKITDISIEGNKEVVTDHIKSILTTKIGDSLDEEKLRKDAEAIFELGFFIATDYRVVDTDDGVKVTFVVRENPLVGSIKFKGNTVYSSEELVDLVFTKPGAIFNRTFFRNDLQRIKEKYQQDGYVMANVADVKIEGDVVTVVISEPKISEIVIQGNKLTKRYIIERYLKIKEGQLFDSNKLRLTMNRLQGVGFFEDVNVNFEPGKTKDEVIVVITVEEGRTSRIGFSLAYGTQSGWGGGLSYDNFNIGGRGLKLGSGFNLGHREEFWLNFEQPFLNAQSFAWRVGVYKRNWNYLRYYFNKTITLPDGSSVDQFKYARDKVGAYVGFGRKFKEESKYNWYLTFDWHKVKNEPESLSWSDLKDIEVQHKHRTVRVMDDLGEGDYYSTLLTLRRFNLDEYLLYPKGDVETLNIQYGTADITDVDTDFNYFKYWFEAKVYIPVDKYLKEFFESALTHDADKPVTLAARLRIGSASGDVPFEEMYSVGGDRTMRGFREEQFRGEDMLLGNVELRIPIEKAFGFVVFYDFGRAWRKDAGMNFGDDIEDAPGIGVRLKTPLGNLRLDYASGYEDRFHFGFGEMF